ncbi:MAG: sugar phosphate isomerase/epimerase family protein [Terriglobia bacterium]
MNYGLSTSLFAEERLNSHTLDKILAAGLRDFEIMAARQHLDYHDPNQLRDVAQWFSDHAVTLHSLHAPLFSDWNWGRAGGLMISVAHLGRRLRIASMDEIKRAIEVAELLPFRYLVLHLGLPDEEYDLRKFDAAFTSIEHLNIFAKERGAEILLENIPSELSAPEHILSFLHYTRLDLKVCFDTGHAHMAGGVQPAFRMLRDRIAVMHIHDNHGEKDEHLLPYEGEIDWAQAIPDFRSAGVQFPILFELNYERKEPNTLARVREVIDRFEAVP